VGTELDGLCIIILTSLVRSAQIHEKNILAFCFICSHFFFIEILNLERNDLHGPIPDTFKNLSKLIVLALGTNQLDSSIPGPDVFEGMERLELLDVAQNRLTGTISIDNPLCTRGVNLLLDCTLGREIDCKCENHNCVCLY